MATRNDTTTAQVGNQPQGQDSGGCPTGCRVVPPDYEPIERRADLARDFRVARAQTLRNQPLPHNTPATPLCNEEEDAYTDSTGGENRFIAMYSKGLKHVGRGAGEDQTGEVYPDAYCALLRGLQQNSVEGFDREVGPYLGCQPVTGQAMPGPLAGFRLNVQTSGVAHQIRLVNPLAAQSFNLRGMDSQQILLFRWGHFDGNGQVERLPFPKPPRFDSPDKIAEMAELYWMALCRDVPFSAYATHPTTRAAAQSLAKFEPLYSAGYPYRPGVVANDPTTLFRGFTHGDRVGPYVSQFLVRPVPLGALTIDPRIRTVKTIDGGGLDYLTNFDNWLAVQNGCMPATELDLNTFDPTARVPHNGRDMGQYVHVDILFQEYLNACVILAENPDPTAPAPPGLTVPTKPNPDPTKPPLNLVGGGIFDPVKYRLVQDRDAYHPLKPFPGFGSMVQQGFGTFGVPDFKVLVSEVAKLALKAVWYQKWSVHRRLRPEEFGGRIDAHKNGKRVYPFDPAAFRLLDNEVLQLVKDHNAKINARLTPPVTGDAYFLPMAFPEGCPTHPAYAQGHATVAGACVTVLKALFRNASFAELNATVVEPDANGTSLVVSAADPAKTFVHDELDKLASNVGLARDFAGVHWRTDYINGLRLGETVAIWFLCDIRREYREHFQVTFKTFDGHQVTIDNEFDACFRSGQDAGLSAR